MYHFIENTVATVGARECHTEKIGWMQAILMNINTEASSTNFTVVVEKPCRHQMNEHK